MHHTNGSHGGGVRSVLGTYPQFVTFERWPGGDGGVDVVSDDSRRVWYPALGAVAWELWARVAAWLGEDDEWVCSLTELGRPVGLVGGEVPLALGQMVRYGLADRVDVDRWQVRAACPLSGPRERPDRHDVLVHYTLVLMQARALRLASSRPLVELGDRLPSPHARDKGTQNART